MSATFRLAKQKPTQQELRRLMSEQKNNQTKSATASAATSGGAKRIDSPLAKYNDLGQLQCVLCKTTVRSADVWKVHINAKQHKQNIELAKQLKEQTNNFTSVATAAKRKASISTAALAAPDIPEKKIRGILKNSTSASTSSAPVDTNATTAPENTNKSAIPSDFFDAPTTSGQGPLSFYAATMQKTSIRQDLLSINRESLQPTDAAVAAKATEDEAMQTNGGGAAPADEPLPEGFFDDPVKDAKARNLEYKDPVEEEWDRFQKEIKAAADTSNAIMAEDQVEATTERQIDEIDEQIRNWSRVLTLEKKKEIVRQTVAKLKSQVRVERTDAETDSDSSDDDESAPKFDEFLDWRAKRSQLKATAEKDK